MPRKIGATLLLVGLAALGYSTLFTGQQIEQTFVAVVRADGSMVPIAAFDGREWWNRWPEASGREDEVPPVPSSVSSVPSDWLPPGMRLPAEWRLYTGNGRAVPVKALRPVRTSMLEQYVIGLQTDFKGRDAPDEPADVLAISGTATIGGFVRASSREADAIAKQLTDRLATIEQTEIARWVKETERPSDTAQKLRRVFRDAQQENPVTLSLMRAERPFNGRTYYHLTGEKLYALGDTANDSCKMNMSFDGVVGTDRSGRVAFENVSAFAFAEYCGDAASSNDLIATIQVRDQLIWVGIENLEDGFSYFLMDPRTKDPVRLRRHPFVRVRVAFYDDGCSIADLCQTLDGIRSAVASRSLADLAPYISSKATEQIGTSRNLLTELKDPRSVAWPTLERILTLGGRVRRWVGGPTQFCAPGIHAAWASSDAQAFRDGVEVDSLWAIAVPFASVFESPRESAKVVATAGHELVAVTEAANWDAPNADESWVTLRWDRAPAYVRRVQLHGPNDPGVCLDLDSGSWRITYFRQQFSR